MGKYVKKDHAESASPFGSRSAPAHRIAFTAPERAILATSIAQYGMSTEGLRRAAQQITQAAESDDRCRKRFMYECRAEALGDLSYSAASPTREERTKSKRGRPAGHQDEPVSHFGPPSSNEEM